MHGSIDFETRSKIDLTKVGAWNYSRHPSTEVMCLNWSYGEESGSWHMRHGQMIVELGRRMAKTSKRKDAKNNALTKKFKANIQALDETAPPTRLFELIAQGIQFEAHNAFFERTIWQHICVERMGWPAIEDDSWLCSAAKTSMHALPRDLERASLEMVPDCAKDTDGKRVMLKLCKPAKPTKAWPDREWHEEPEDLDTLWAYCEQDVASEEALSKSLDELPDFEFDLWQMDQRMNLRGMYCDLDLARKAISLASELVDQLNAELAQVTNGELEKASQRAKIKEWINGQVDSEDEIPGTGAPVLDRLMATEKYDDTPVKTVVDIVLAVNRTSIRKYQAMLDRADHEDQRIRDMMMYHGAGTGRWAGRGVQPHNFPRGSLKDMEAMCADLLEYDLDELLMCYSRKQLMNILSWALRGALCAPPGRQLYVADYAAIEARGLVWLAEDKEALAVFHAGKDIYKDMATAIYKVKYEDVTDEMRRLGKQAILGLGYQMGAPKFWDTLAGYEPHYKGVEEMDTEFMMLPGDQILNTIKAFFKNDEELVNNLKYGWGLTEQQRARIKTTFARQPLELRMNVKYFLFMRDVVITYRKKYKSVVDMWKLHKSASIQAVESGEPVRAGMVTWAVSENNFLTCELPSGRLLYYRNPTIGINKFKQKALYYWSVDAVTKQWRKTGTYGGKLVENITQAVARDLMAFGMMEVDRHDDYDLLASVHDELIAEADLDRGDVEEFETLMATLPPWATGCPVKAEGWSGLRYRK